MVGRGLFRVLTNYRRWRVKMPLWLPLVLLMSFMVLNLCDSDCLCVGGELGVVYPNVRANE